MQIDGYAIFCGARSIGYSAGALKKAARDAADQHQPIFEKRRINAADAPLSDVDLPKQISLGCYIHSSGDSASSLSRIEP